MIPELERARAIARELRTGNAWLDTEQAGEIAHILDTLADAAQAHNEKLQSVEFALSYYSEPQLYIDHSPRSPHDPILDGGLRARTALSLLRMRSRVLARRV
jgi:hypothetical protein